MRDWSAVALLAVIGGALAACGRSDGAEPAGELRARWAGADTGVMAAPARARWCDSLRLLEVTAIVGDSGVALAIYPADSLRADSFPVRNAALRDDRRPWAAVALRGLASATVPQFRGTEGQVWLERVDDGLVSGRVAAVMQPVTGVTPTTFEAEFEDVPVEVVPETCFPADAPPRPTPPPADSGVRQPPDSGLN